MKGATFYCGAFFIVYESIKILFFKPVISTFNSDIACKNVINGERGTATLFFKKVKYSIKDGI
ncbi:MAG: hypothetical protein ABF652_21790 [Clostridium beijerinckii]